MHDYLLFSAGVTCAALGGELFVRGTVGIAHWARISPGIIGATIAAFATSSPELSVSISAASAGDPQLALGDALGSNVVNVALILGIALCISPMKSPRHSIRRDFPVALAIPLLTGVLCLDGALSRIDGITLSALFGFWLIAVVADVRKQRSAAYSVIGEHRGWLALCQSVAGLAFLVTAGRLIVAGAKGIAVSLDIDEFVVGTTIVAVGTSAPELATVIIAKLRGHDEVGLGTILGSNIFNGLLIVGVAAVISPVAVNLTEVFFVLSMGVVAVVFSLPDNHGWIGRPRGILLVSLYLIYVITSVAISSGEQPGPAIAP